MNAKKKYKLVAELVAEYNEILGEAYTCEMDIVKSVIVKAKGDQITGVLVKGIVALAFAYKWTFGIRADQDGHPYIVIV